MGQYLGQVDPNKIVHGQVPVSTGDTFIAESTDCCGVAAYSYEPGCRSGQGAWNNFRLLCTGTRTDCQTAAIAKAKGE